MKEWLSVGAAGLFLTVILYAADWQRDQDKGLSDLKSMVTEQKTILEMQIKFNKELQKERDLRRLERENGRRSD